MRRALPVTRTAEVTQPWVVYTYGLSHDLWWPPKTSTRWTGRAKIRITCAVCGVDEVCTLRIPRWGKVPEPPTGRHPARQRFLDDHAHPDRGLLMTWALPLLNPAAAPGGLDLTDLLRHRFGLD
jgi:hypothetical protein